MCGVSLKQWFPTFFDSGPNLIFQVSWRATEVSSTSSCLHDGRLRTSSAHTSSYKRSGKCTQWRVFNFTRRPPKSVLCSPPKPKSIRLESPSRAQTSYSPFFSTTTHPAPKPQICTVFLLPLPALKPHLFHLSFPTFPQNHAATDVSSPTGSVWGRAPAANDFSAF